MYIHNENLTNLDLGFILLLFFPDIDDSELLIFSRSSLAKPLCFDIINWLSKWRNARTRRQVNQLLTKF